MIKAFVLTVMVVAFGAACTIIAAFVAFAGLLWEALKDWKHDD